MIKCVPHLGGTGVKEKRVPVGSTIDFWFEASYSYSKKWGCTSGIQTGTFDVQIMLSPDGIVLLRKKITVDVDLSEWRKRVYVPIKADKPGKYEFEVKDEFGNWMYAPAWAYSPEPCTAKIGILSGYVYDVGNFRKLAVTLTVRCAGGSTPSNNRVDLYVDNKLVLQDYYSLKPGDVVTKTYKDIRPKERKESYVIKILLYDMQTRKLLDSMEVEITKPLPPTPPPPTPPPPPEPKPPTGEYPPSTLPLSLLLLLAPLMGIAILSKHQ